MSPKESSQFEKQEEKRQVAEVASANAEIADKTIIFWSRAELCVIGNWRKEVISAGRIVRPEQGLRFHDHIRTTEDPEMIKFVRGSNAFECGDIVECAKMQDAMDLTLKQRIRKNKTELKAEDVSRTEIRDANPAEG